MEPTTLLPGSLPVWQTTRFTIDLAQPRVMGIVNVTPDSFSDQASGGTGTRARIDHCKRLLDEGADLLDIGGESTRPGAEPVSVDEELRRVMPVLQAALGLGCPVSVDTLKTNVMREALAAGTDVVNDVTALRSEGAARLIAEHARCGVCLVHMQGEPRSMQAKPHYEDVVTQVRAFLAERAAVLRTLGVAADRIAIDPGIGFGKTVEHNFELLRRQRELASLGYPLLAGWSNKSSLGVVTGRSVADRVHASVAAALVAVLNGARIVRVHDVAATVDALKIWRAAGWCGA